jgi:hypothetical protein
MTSVENYNVADREASHPTYPSEVIFDQFIIKITTSLYICQIGKLKLLYFYFDRNIA